jgi:hypothetical protein
MINQRIELKATRAKKTFKKLLKRLNDYRPIWRMFVKFYQDDIMKRTWDSKGRLMEGTRWKSLTPAYLNWKRKHHSGQRLLELTGRLFDAVQGGQGWFDRIRKKDLTMGVKGEEYFYWVQHRAKYDRHYFYTEKEDIPNRAYTYLIKITQEYLEDVE